MSIHLTIKNKKRPIREPRRLVVVAGNRFVLWLKTRAELGLRT